MKYSRSAITQLTRWYRQVLIKCAILNAAIMAGTFGMPAVADATEINQNGVPFQTNTTIDNAANPHIFNISTTTTNGAGNIGLNTFGRFNVSEGDTANLNLINQQNKLVNLVFDSSASQIDGIVNSYKNGQIGGDVLFANPNGFVVGKTGVFNVGSLTLMTPTEDTMKKVFKDNAVNDDTLNSLVSFRFGGDNYVLYDEDSDVALYPGRIEINGTINSGAGIDLINGGTTIEIGTDGSLNANMNFSGTGSNVTPSPKNSVTPNTKTGNTYKFASDGGNGIIITSANSGEDRDYLSAIVNLNGKVKANGGDVHVQTEIYQTDAKEDKAVSKINVKNGADIEGHDVTMRAYSHIDGADKNILGMSGKSSDWQNILNGTDILNYLVEDFVHLGDIKTQVIVEDGAKINASNDLTLKAEAKLPIAASSIFETFAFNYTDLDILTEAVIKSGADIKAGRNLTVQALTDFEMTNDTKASSLAEIIADTFKPFGNYGAYALNISLIDMVNRAVIENGAHLDVKNNISVLASMLRNYTGTTKNGLIPVVDRNRGSAGIGISIMDFTARNEAIMNADATIDGSLVVNADYEGSIKNTVSASSAAAGQDGNFGLVGRIAQGILGHGKLTKVFDFLETSKKSRAEATFNKIQIAGAINVAIDEAVNNAYIGDAANNIKPTITAKNVTVGATLLDNKSQVYASAEADNGETSTSGAVAVNLKNLDSNADVYGNLTLTGSDADNALIIRSKTDIQHIEGLWDWIKQTAIGFGWEPTEEEPNLKHIDSANVDDYLAQYGMSDDYQKKIDDLGSKFALFNMINFNDIGLNGLFGTFASSQANAASKGAETKAWAGAVSVAVTNAVSNALLHDGSTVNILNTNSSDIKQNIIIQANSVSEVWSGAVLMSLFNAKAAFAGLSARDGDSAGGSLSIAVSDIDTTAKIGENVKITGQNSNITVKAEEDGEFINIGNGSASADNAGLGGEFVVSDVAGGTTNASVEKGAEIKNAKDVKVNADRDDVYVNAAVAYTNSQNSKSFGISPLIVSNAVTAYIAGNITATGKVEVETVYDKIIVNTAANLGVAKAGTDNPVFTDMEPEDDDSGIANLDVLFENLSVIQSPVDPTKYVKTDFTRPLSANKETSAYAGNIVTNIFDSDITAYIADNAKIVADSLKVNASSSDMIIDVGAVVAANGKSGGGATILFDMSKNQINSYIGNAIVDVMGDLTVNAQEEYTMIDVQAGIAHGKDKSGVGNLSVNLQLNEINAGIKDGAKINTNIDNENQSVSVSANLANKTLKVVGGLSIQAGGNANGGAKGATLDANVYVNDINAYIGNADVNAGKKLDVTAESTSKTIGIDVAGAGSTGDSAYAGTLGTYISTNNVDAHINGARINQTTGRANKSAAVKVKGSSTYNEVAVVGTVAGGKSTAVGGSISARIIADTIDSYIENATLNAASSLTLENKAEIKSVAVTVAGSASTSANAVDGAIMAVIDATTQNNYIENSTINTNSVTLDSDNIYNAIGVTGALAISAGNNAVGGSIYVSVTDNDMNTYIKNSDVTAQNDINMTSDINTDSLSIIFAAAGGKGVAASGAISTVVNSPDVDTYISSDNNNKKVVSDEGKINIKSKNTTDIDTINGAISISASNNAVGASINAVVDSSDVSAGINGMKVSAEDDVDVDAESEEKIMSISIGGAGGSGITAAGSINTVVMASDTDAYIKNSVVNADSVHVTSSGITEITGGTGTLSISMSSLSLGASVVTGVIDNEVTAVIENSKIDADEDVVVSAEADETIGKSDAPFITVAGGFSQNVALEGVVDTMVLSSTADAHIKGTKSITTKDANNNDIVTDYGVTAGNDVSITAQGKDTIFAIGGSVSASAQTGIGATINTIVVDKDVDAYAENTKITATHDIKAEATETDDFFTTLVAASGAGTAGVSGVVNTNVITSDLNAGFINSTLEAGNKISSNAEAKADMQTITGAVSGGGSAGVGLSAVNDIIRYLAESKASGVNANFKDLDVKANADSTYSFSTVSGAVGGSAGVAGVENVNLINNDIKAYATGNLKGDKATIEATDKVTFENSYSGVLAGGGTAGVGATVEVNSVTSTILAYIGGDIKVDDVTIHAKGEQDFDGIFVAGFSAAGTAAVSGTALANIVETTVKAYVADNAKIYSDDETDPFTSKVSVKAENETKLRAYIGAAAIGASAAGVGVTVGVNQFKNTVEAYTGNNVEINSANVEIKAKSTNSMGKENDKLLAIAGAAGLYAGVAGTVMYNSVEDKIAAYVENNNTIKVANNGKLDIKAEDTTNIYENIGSGGVGLVGLGASVGYSSIKNTVLAYVGTSTAVEAKGANVSISAQSNEKVDGDATVVSGGVALSGGVLYSSIGQKKDNALSNDLTAKDKEVFNAAKKQADDMISNAGSKNSGANSAYKSAYGDALSKAGNQVDEDSRIKTMTGAVDDLFAKSANSGSSIPGSAEGRNGTTSAFVDSGANIKAKNLSINAQNIDNVNLETSGYSVGAISVGASIAVSDDKTTTNSFISNNAVIDTDTLNLKANSQDVQYVKTIAAAGGTIFGGSGSAALVNSDKTTNSYILKDTLIQAKDGINIEDSSRSDIDAIADAYAGSFTGAVGVSVARANSIGKTRIDVGDGVTLVGGDINIATNTNEDTYAESVATTGGLISGSGADSTATTGKDSTINIGKNFIVNATGDMTIKSESKNKSYAEAQGRAYGAVSAGGATSDANIKQTSGINIADADETKNITIGSFTASSTADNRAETQTTAGAGAAVGISGSRSGTDITSINNIYIGQNYNITTTNGNYAANADTYNQYKSYIDGSAYGVVGVAIPFIRNYVDSTVSADSETNIESAGSLLVTAKNEIRKDAVSGYDLYGGAGGLASGSGGSIKDELTMATNAKLGGNKARANGAYGKGDITIGAYNVAKISEKADLYAHGGIAGADTDSIVYLTANAKTEITNTNISNYDDNINYTARNDVDIYTKSNVESYGGVAGTGGDSKAQSSKQHADVIISGAVKSRSGRSTNISALSNKSLEAYIYERTRGLASVISGDSYAYNNDSEASIDIKSGAEVKSYDSMNLSALSSTQKLSATRDAIAYQLWGIPYKGKGNTHSENNNSSSITINGAVESGLGANRKLTINNDGTYTADGVNVLGQLKVGEITSADIDNDIQIYQNSINRANEEYADFVTEQDKLIEGYQKTITDNTSAKTEKETQNAGYQDSITIWNAIGDIDAADFATTYADSAIEEIQNVITALQSGNADNIKAAKDALKAKQPSLTVEQLNDRITENNNSIDTYTQAIELANVNKTAAEMQKTAVAERHTSEITQLQGYITALEAQKAAGTTTNIYVMTIDNVKVRSGETNLRTGMLSGSGSITAPGNTFTITVDNNSVNSVQYGDLIIDRNLDGGIHINASGGSSVAKTIINPNYNSKIVITNNVDANDPTINFEGQSGDIWLKGNVENVNGIVDITNFTGSILSEGSITAKDLYMKAPNGELSQVYDPNERKTGSMIAGGDISYAAKTININGLIQSGTEVKNIEIPEFSITFENGKYYQTVNGNKTEMKPSEMTEGYYYLSLLDYTQTLNSIQKIKTYFKPVLVPVVDEQGNPVLDANGQVQTNPAVDADGHIQGEIYLFKAHIGGGNITLTGNIVSDSNNGKIVLVNGYGHIDVTNNSDYDLVTSALNADDKVEGVLTINDFKVDANNQYINIPGHDPILVKTTPDYAPYNTITQEDLTPEYLAGHAGTYTVKVNANGQLETTAENITDGNGSWGEASYTQREDGANVYSTTYNPGSDAYMITEQGKMVSYQVYVKRSWIVELFDGKKYETRYYYQEPKYGVKANAIAVNFQGFDKPEINITSKGNVVMNSNISALTGDVNITSQNGNIVTKSSSNVISANNIILDANGNIGEEVVEGNVYRPIQTAIFDNGKLTAAAGSNIYVNFPYTEISNIDLNAGNGNGIVYLATAAGDFNGTEKQVSIKADALNLRADYIGLDTTTNDAINIDIKQLKARAKDDITITNKGDIVVSSIVSENGGSVTIESQEGSIIAADDTGTYSDKHIHGGDIVLKAMNGAIATKESILKFANDGIFHVEAKDGIYLGSAGNIYVDLIKSSQGNVELGSQRGIIASTITDEDRYYNIAGKNINLEAWGGSIENIALSTDGTVNASTYSSGVGDINLAMISQKPLSADSTREEIDAFNANAKDLTIGIIKAGNNVTLSSEKGIKQDYSYSNKTDFGISGERITLNATGDVGGADAPVNTKVNRTISVFSSADSNVYLSANNAGYGMKINTIDTHNGNGSLGTVSLISAGHILDNAEKSSEEDKINIRAENISLKAIKNIGSVDDYMVVETTSSDIANGLAYEADKAYIKGVGSLLNIVQGDTAKATTIIAQNTAISANNITADNDAHDASLMLISQSDISLSNAKSQNITVVSGNDVVISDDLTTDHLSLISTGETIITDATITYLTNGEHNDTLVDVQSDDDTTVKDTTVDGDINIDANENIKISDVNITGDLNADAENIKITEIKLDGNLNAIVDDIAINTSHDLHIGEIKGNSEEYTDNVVIASVKNITNGLTSGDTNISAQNIDLTAGNSIGKNQALNIVLKKDNNMNMAATDTINLNNKGAVANYDKVTSDNVIINSEKGVNIADLNADNLALTTKSTDVNITGNVETKGEIRTVDKRIVIDNTSLEPDYDAMAQLYLSQKPMHLIVDASNNIHTESKNVTRHSLDTLVNKEGYETSMEGEITLSVETGIKNSYHGEGMLNEAEKVPYNMPTLSDYNANILKSQSSDNEVRDDNGTILNSANIMAVVRQKTQNRAKNQQYEQNEKRKKNADKLKKAENSSVKGANRATGISERTSHKFVGRQYSENNVNF